jgi:hexokinase
MTDVPKDLLDQINRLEDLFLVPAEKLKEVTNHFVKELEKGLTVEGGSIVSITALRSASPEPELTSKAHEPNLVHGLPRWL